MTNNTNQEKGLILRTARQWGRRAHPPEEPILEERPRDEAVVVSEERGAGRAPGATPRRERKPRSVPPYLCQGPEFDSHLHPIRPHRSWLDELISPLPIPHHTPTGTQFILQTSRGSGRPKKIAIFQPSQAALKTKALFFMLFPRESVFPLPASNFL